MIDLATLDRWLVAPAESERLEFKEAKQQFDTDKLLRYCAALANEGGGHLVLGVSDGMPRRVVSTRAFASPVELNGIKSHVVVKLDLRVDATELQHADGRVLVFEVPSRPRGQAIALDGAYLMRAGEDTVAMTPDRLKRIFAEDGADWFGLPAKSGASAGDVIALLDTQAYFDLVQIPYPTTRDAVLDRLVSEGLIARTGAGWTITNLAAIVLAKKLDAFSPALARKAPRVIIYDGPNKLKTRSERQWVRGYAVAFDELVEDVHSSAPQNRFVEELRREEIKMFPRLALRELIANALVHQDFQASGMSVMIEMYDDRVEISNPGVSPVPVDRFIDGYRSRNEQLADLMRRMGICEEKGSGIDKVVEAAENDFLPAPDFRVDFLRTTVVLFAHREFAEMSRSDRIRACYQHCCLQYVTNRRMSNQSLRERFQLSPANAAAASQVIGATKDAGLILLDDTEGKSTRFARYLPFWASKSA